MLLWNAKHVQPPAMRTVAMNQGDLDIDKLEVVCRKAVSILENLQHLHTEAGLLSRVLYRMKSKYRQNVGFKHLEKVNRGLLQYLSLDLLAVYSSFASLVPEAPRDARVYLPTLQILQWVLVRTQGFAKLFCFVAQECQLAARHLHSLVTMGHTWEVALLCLGLAGRIWTIAKYLVTCSCDWYSQLKPFLENLKCSGQRWLPGGYEFPEDLVKWLDAPWLTEQHDLKSNVKTGVDKLLSRLMSGSNDSEGEDVLGDSQLDIVDLAEGKEDDAQAESHEVDEESLVKGTGPRLAKRGAELNNNSEMVTFQQPKEKDFGEKISRSSLKRSGKEAKYHTPKKLSKSGTDTSNSALKNLGDDELQLQKKKRDDQDLTNGTWKKKEVKVISVEDEDEKEENSDSDVIVGDMKRVSSTFTEREDQGARPQTVTTGISKQDSKTVRKQNRSEKLGKAVSESVQSAVLRLSKADNRSKVKLKAGKAYSQTTVPQVESSVSEKQVINALRTSSDLETFLDRESELREKCKKACVTRDMDKLQWNMLRNAVSVYLTKLKKKSVQKDKERYELLMRKARKAIKLRIL